MRKCIHEIPLQNQQKKEIPVIISAEVNEPAESTKRNRQGMLKKCEVRICFGVIHALVDHSKKGNIGALSGSSGKF